MLGTYPLSTLPLSTLEVVVPPVVAPTGGGPDYAPRPRRMQRRMPNPQIDTKRAKLLREDDEVLAIIKAILSNW